MKKNFLSLFFALLLVPLVSEAASSVSVANIMSNTGDGGTAGTITQDLGIEGTTTGGHEMFSGGFDDVWDFTNLPSATTFNIVNTGATLSSINIEYCIFSDAMGCNSVDNFTNYASGTAATGDSLTASLVDISAFRLRIWGEGTEGSSYLLSAAPVTAVPVPGALWLFGSALMGLVGYTRSRYAK